MTLDLSENEKLTVLLNAAQEMRIIVEEYGRHEFVRVEITYPHLTFAMRDALHPDCSLVLTPDRAAELTEKLTEALELLKVPDGENG